MPTWKITFSGKNQHGGYFHNGDTDLVMFAHDKHLLKVSKDLQGTLWCYLQPTRYYQAKMWSLPRRPFTASASKIVSPAALVLLKVVHCYWCCNHSYCACWFNWQIFFGTLATLNTLFSIFPSFRTLRSVKK